MIRKVITTLGIVLLAIGMLSCEDSSTPSGPKFAELASQNALVEGTGITSYTVTLDKAVALAEGVADAAALAGKVTLVHTLKTTGEASTTAPVVSTVAIDGKTIELTFGPTNFAVGDKLKIEIEANSIADTTTAKVKNAAMSVEVTAVAPGPAFAATQDPIYPGAKTTYTVVLDTNVALVDGKVLKDEITLTHGAATVALTSATISTTSANNIDLVFTSTTFAVNDTFKIDIAAGAIQSTATPPVMNAAMITTTVTVVAVPAAPAKAATQATLTAGSVTSYQVALNNAVELFAASTDLKSKFTLHHVDGGTESSITITTVAINADDATKIDLVFTSTTFTTGQKLKIVIAADAVKNKTSDATANVGITIEVTTP